MSGTLQTYRGCTEGDNGGRSNNRVSCQGKLHHRYRRHAWRKQLQHTHTNTPNTRQEETTDEKWKLNNMTASHKRVENEGIGFNLLGKIHVLQDLVIEVQIELILCIVCSLHLSCWRYYSLHLHVQQLRVIVHSQ